MQTLGRGECTSHILYSSVESAHKKCGICKKDSMNKILEKWENDISY